MEVLAIPEHAVANPTAGYMPVQIEMLLRMRQTTVDLYIPYESDAEPVLYHRAGCALEAGQASRLLETGVRQIYVRSDDFHSFAANLLETIDSDSETETVPAAERYAA